MISAARGGELDGEVAIGHRVERIRTQALEAEFASDLLAIDGKARAGERGAA